MGSTGRHRLTGPEALERFEFGQYGALLLPGALTWGGALSLGDAPTGWYVTCKQALASAVDAPSDTTTDFEH